ncbi:hypothetical protein CC80DRAFT_534074 [Byssothecium circinans]|uniref:Uncharacterized protein n=1 Tax=Byssothecium circinans TaxID=147558 RepID=A0A6A5U068_9PLEO|nr:hypothetical protein CC80DRAFT_534074 [Byssothecium circinans]
MTSPSSWASPIEVLTISDSNPPSLITQSPNTTTVSLQHGGTVNQHQQLYRFTSRKRISPYASPSLPLFSDTQTSTTKATYKSPLFSFPKAPPPHSLLHIKKSVEESTRDMWFLLPTSPKQPSPQQSRTTSPPPTLHFDDTAPCLTERPHIDTVIFPPCWDTYVHTETNGTFLSQIQHTLRLPTRSARAFVHTTRAGREPLDVAGLVACAWAWGFEFGDKVGLRVVHSMDGRDGVAMTNAVVAAVMDPRRLVSGAESVWTLYPDYLDPGRSSHRPANNSKILKLGGTLPPMRSVILHTLHERLARAKRNPRMASLSNFLG